MRELCQRRAAFARRVGMHVVGVDLSHVLRSLLLLHLGARRRPQRRRRKHNWLPIIKFLSAWRTNVSSRWTIGPRAGRTGCPRSRRCCRGGHDRRWICLCFSAYHLSFLTSRHVLWLGWSAKMVGCYGVWRVRFAKWPHARLLKIPSNRGLRLSSISVTVEFVAAARYDQLRLPL